MKKVLTAMTAMTMTLQASENLNQEIINKESDSDKSKIDFETFKNNLNNQYNSENFVNAYNKSNSTNLAGSGSFVGFEKTVTLGLDADVSGTVSSGDVLIYDLFVENNDNVNASGLFIEDVLDSNTDLISGSVTTSQGNIINGNQPNDTFVEVNVGNLDIAESVIVSFSATINVVPDGQIIDIVNQAVLETDNVGTILSDDPSSFSEPYEPTVIRAQGATVDLYDEFDEDDFAAYHEVPTPIELRTEVDRIKGSIGGPGVDLEDCFTFTVEPHRVVNSIILESYETSGDNQSTDYHIYLGLPPVKFSEGNFYRGVLTENGLSFSIMPGRTMIEGDYSVCLIEATPDQDYSLVFLSEIEDNIFNSSFEQPKP